MGINPTSHDAMRSIFFAALALTASPLAAQQDPLRSVSFGVGPASGLEGAAVYTDLRADLALTPSFSVRPVLGFTGEAGREEPVPCLVPPCPVQRVGRGVGVAPGMGFAASIPETRLPDGLADAHVGVLAQAVFGPSPGVEFRYGVEAGAAVRVTSRVAVGASVQASRYAVNEYPQRFDVRRSSLAPMVRVLYRPARSASPDPAPSTASRQGMSFNLGSGLATGFEAGALHTDLRVRIPLGAAGLAIEPMLGWTEAFAYDGPDPICEAMDPAGPFYACPAERAEGADALLIGAVLSTQSNGTPVLGLADAYGGIGADLVSPTRAPNQYRFSAMGGLIVPVARGLAVGGEVQASLYSHEARDGDRGVLSFTPALRLSVGG